MKLIVVLIILITVTLFFVIDPISQPQNYYDFSDYINYYGINNFCNVISNIPFIIVGLVGLFLNKKQKLNHDNYSTTPVYSLFFLGVFLTGFGSSWFHLNPNNETLVWDRLPMTMGFMALTVGLLSEYFKRELQKQLLYPFIFIGFFSVMYWYFTEKAGRGDLRLYALVQFVPLIIIPAVALTHKSRYTRSLDLIWLLTFYVLAKVAEHYDQAIHQVLGLISGHSLKHLLAAGATYILLRMLLRRKLLCNQSH
tara:strand:+ start:24533 stop:25291 length:759 start_codon:yes stop_codon:yes gene_type:complete